MQKTGNLQKRQTNMLKLLILSVLCVSGSLLVRPQRAFAGNSDLPLPAGLKAEGLPPVPADVVEKAGRYTSSRTATLQSWHPTRREMLITTRFGETNQVHKVAAPGGDRSQLTFFSDPVQSASFHPGDGKYVILLKDENGDERHQLYRLDLDSNEIFKLTSDREPVVSPVWSHSGEWLLYTSGKRTEKTMDVYLINPLDQKAERRVAEIDAAYLQILDVSPDDQKAIAYQYISAEETALWLIDIKTGSVERITPSAKDKVAYWSAAFSRDGKGIFLTSDAKGEFSKLGYLDLATRNISFIETEQKGDIESTALSPDRERIAYVANEEGIGRLHVLNLGSKKEETLPDLPVGKVTNLQWRNAHELGFNLETARYPADVYSFDVRSKRIERWTMSETGGINTGSLPDAKLIHWPTFDRRQISGFHYGPPPNKFTGPRPVLIDIHGGPQLQARPTYGGRYFYYINELGMVVIFPNVRGSSGFGKTFLSLDNLTLRGNSVKDLQALLDYIEKQPELEYLFRVSGRSG